MARSAPSQVRVAAASSICPDCSVISRPPATDEADGGGGEHQVDVELADLVVVHVDIDPGLVAGSDAARRPLNHLPAAGRGDCAARRVVEKLVLAPPATTTSKASMPADGLTYAARIDGADLFPPFLEILNAGMIADSRDQNSATVPAPTA